MNSAQNDTTHTNLVASPILDEEKLELLDELFPPDEDASPTLDASPQDASPQDASPQSPRLESKKNLNPSPSQPTDPIAKMTSTPTDYTSMTQEQLIALVQQQQQALAVASKPRKTQRRPAPAVPDYEDHYIVRKFSLKGEQNDIIRKNKSMKHLEKALGGEYIDKIFNVLKTIETKLEFVMIKTYIKGTYSLETSILIQGNYGEVQPKLEGASSTTFLLERKGADYPQEWVNKVAQSYYNHQQTDIASTEKAISLATEKPGVYYFPKEKSVIAKIIKKCWSKDTLLDEAYLLLLGQTEALSRLSNPATMRIRSCCLPNRDLLKKTKSAGLGNGTLNSVKDGVITDMSKKENRQKHLKIAPEKSRCSCLLDIESKGRCLKAGKWLLPNRMFVCSAHAGQLLQTKYLLDLDEKKTTPPDYSHGCKAGWCYKQCEGHTCKCKRNKDQQDYCKKAFKELTDEQKKEYKALRSKDTPYEKILYAHRYNLIST